MNVGGVHLQLVTFHLKSKKIKGKDNFLKREAVIMSRKTKNIDHELCDYDEAYDRESASNIGWCGKCKIPECPYNKDLNEKRRIDLKTMKRKFPILVKRQRA